MAHRGNKTELVSFFAPEWTKPVYAQRLCGKSLHVMVGKDCVRLTSLDGQQVSTIPVPALESTHDKADRCLQLHAANDARLNEWRM